MADIQPSGDGSVFGNIGVGVGIVLAVLTGLFALFDMIKHRVKRKKQEKECDITITSLNYILLKHKEYCRMVDRIMLINILKEQMNVFMRKVERICIDCEALYRSLLKGLDTEEIQYNVTEFDVAVNATIAKLIDDFRKLCRENHFIEYTETEFIEYVEYNSLTFSRKFISNLHFNYPKYSRIPNGENLFTEIQKLVQQAIADSLKNARQISFDYIKDIKELDCSFISNLKNEMNIDLAPKPQTCSDTTESQSSIANSHSSVSLLDSILRNRG